MNRASEIEDKQRRVQQVSLNKNLMGKEAKQSSIAVHQNQPSKGQR